MEIKNLQFRAPARILTLIVTVYLLVMFNGRFFRTVYELHGIGGVDSWLYIISLFFFLAVLINFSLTILAIPWLLKPTLIFILIVSSLTCYFMETYNILIDKTMIQNTMETDIRESWELLSFNLLTFVGLSGLIPAALVWKIKIDYGNSRGFALEKLLISIITILIAGFIALLFYQDYASLFRNHRYIRDLIVPVNYVHSLNAYAKQFLPKNTPEFQSIGLDAHVTESWGLPTDKKVVTVIVVGETARSANFSLYDYPRATNPELKRHDIISFSQVSSCGTSTAVSLPCMFSHEGRDIYNERQARNSDNLLDILQRAGLEAVWIDNNSGCKGVCNRIKHLNVSPGDNINFCKGAECYDMVLISKLQQAIKKKKKNMVIVMHQVGSHGPAYFLRTPEEFQKFKPFCHTNQLQECSQQEIINAYDNTILYTDHVLSAVIDFLDSRKNVLDASMLYVSDHGESLGENNLYLHGIPYFMAPEEQTHVPMILWLSNNFAKRFSIDKTCLQNKRQERLSHDNLFDSMIGMLGVQTSIYQRERDIFDSCRGANSTDFPLAKHQASKGVE